MSIAMGEPAPKQTPPSAQVFGQPHVDSIAMGEPPPKQTPPMAVASPADETSIGHDHLVVSHFSDWIV